MPTPDGKSTHIRAIEPHPDGGLVVTFEPRPGMPATRYHYPDAPQDLAQKCLSQPSVGQAFHHFIRSAYRGIKL